MILKSLLLMATAYAGYKILGHHGDVTETKTTTPRKSTTFKNFSVTIDRNSNENRSPFAPITPSHP